MKISTDKLSPDKVDHDRAGATNVLVSRHLKTWKVMRASHLYFFIVYKINSNPWNFRFFQIFCHRQISRIKMYLYPSRRPNLAQNRQLKSIKYTKFIKRKIILFFMWRSRVMRTVTGKQKFCVRFYCAKYQNAIPLVNPAMIIHNTAFNHFVFLIVHYYAVWLGSLFNNASNAGKRRQIFFDDGLIHLSK